MPPKKQNEQKEQKTQEIKSLVSKGAGMVAGLEVWRQNGKFILFDQSTDSRFDSDVALWNTSAGLNVLATKKGKNAKK
jgi:Tol biopolymer transport system component